MAAGDYCLRSQCVGDTGFSRINATNLGMEQADFDTLVDNIITRESRHIDSETLREPSSFIEHDHSVTGKVYGVGRRSKTRIYIDGPVIGDITKVQVRGRKGDTWEDIDEEVWSNKNMGEPYGDQAALYRINQAQDDRSLPRIADRRMTDAEKRRFELVWWMGYENVKVFFKYGYATTPIDIERICIKLVDNVLRAINFKQNKKMGTIRNISAGDPTPMVDIPEDQQLQLAVWGSIKNSVGF